MQNATILYLAGKGGHRNGAESPLGDKITSNRCDSFKDRQRPFTV
jgi:hypothetical protein